MPKREFTPEEITAGLLAFDPAKDKEKPPEEIKIERFEEKKSATQLLKEFMDENGIVLTVTPVSENFKTVSDGSIILQAPKIVVNYK